MGEYVACPNCMNTKKGEWVMRCRRCSTVFCMSCRHEVFFKMTHCPNCKILDWQKLGVISC